MKKSLVNSQITNAKTCLMYKRQMLALAQNVFEYEGLNPFIDVAFINAILVKNGSIAFFKDEVLGVIALPYTVIGSLDVYGRPLKIQVYGQNGYTRELKTDEFVIMYDNNGRYPIYLDIIQYATRIAQTVRTIDINVCQQRTPRIFKTTEEKRLSIEALLNNIEGNNDNVITYSDIDLDDTSAILAPAPYVADKLQQQKLEDWNEFLRLIGVANANFEKKERNISDEVKMSQGGTVASRFTRFEPRLRAIKEINEKWGLNIKLKYYDGIPASFDDFEDDMQSANNKREEGVK